MAVRFYVERVGPDGTAPIRMALLRGGRKVTLTLPIRVRPADWNRRRQRLRRSAPGATEINGALDRLSARVGAMLLSGEPLELLRDRLKRELGLQPREHRLLALFDEWLAVKRLTLRASSLQVLQRVRKHLEGFAGNVPLEQVDRAFLERFQAYLTGQLGQSHATANRLAGYARSFLLWLEDRGLIEKAPRRLALPEPQREVVFLTPAELQAFRDVELSELPPGYEKARTVFLLACFTGLRISDLKAGMRPEAWKTIDLEGGVWLLRERKTNVFRRVPLVAPARRLLRQRLEEGAATPVPVLSAPRCNLYIKEIARRAGITAPVRVGDRELPKWQLLTLHAGRRTFITLVAHAAGTAPLLGLTHTDLDSLQKYLGAWNEHRRRALEETFQGF
ncbi:MAG: site-specific integrase [Rhodothermus sp.]|nr:site-specific integrase [Rhodothermus sp.]